MRRFLELTTTLARSEFKLRYFGSVLGYFWSLARPLMFFGVLYLFFTQIIKIGKGVPHYGVYLLTGIVLWNYFGEATGNCVNCLVAREGLLRKMRFPRLVIPLSVSLTSTFNLAMNFIAVLVFALSSGLTPTSSWLELIPIAFGFVVLGTGFGMLLSALYVRFRDIQPIWEVMLQAWFYCSPIMYTASAYGSKTRVGFGSPAFEHGALINPVAMLLTQMGHAVIGGPHFPSAAVAGGLVSTVIAIALIPGVFALGWWVFAREAPRVAENLLAARAAYRPCRIRASPVTERDLGSQPSSSARPGDIEAAAPDLAGAGGCEPRLARASGPGSQPHRSASDQLQHRGLLTVTDVHRPGQLGARREQVGADDVADLHPVPGLRPIAEDGRGPAVDQLAAEDRHHARLTVDVLPRSVDVAVAQRDRG